MRPPAGSRVQEVTTALKTAFEAIDGVTVVYLAKGNRETRTDTISVAVGRNAVGVQRQKAPGLGMRYQETMRIVCEIRSRSGAKDPAARLARGVEILDQVGAVVLADPRLGGVCDEALLGPDESWTFEDSTSGPDALCRFSILTKTNV